MRQKKLSKEIIIYATIALIEEKESIHNVNFREIARRLACAHTSLYNFFPSFEALILATGMQIMIDMRQTLTFETMERVRTGNYKRYTLAYIHSVLEFALAHPGWYRFLWLEHFDIDFSELFQNHQRPEILLLPYYISEQDQPMIASEAAIRLKLAHGFVHGELCKYLSGRSQSIEAKDFISSTLDHVTWLLNLSA